MNPPLPDAEYFGESMGNDIIAYTEAQLLAYRDACIEMCAKVCRDLHANDQTNILYAAKVIKELK